MAPGLRLRGQGSGGLRALSCKVQVEKDVDAVGAALCGYVQGLALSVRTSRLLTLARAFARACSLVPLCARAFTRTAAHDASAGVHSQMLPRRRSPNAAPSLSPFRVLLLKLYFPHSIYMLPLLLLPGLLLDCTTLIAVNPPTGGGIQNPRSRNLPPQNKSTPTPK